MRKFLIIVFLFVNCVVFAQKSGEKFYYKNLGWTIVLPEGFEVLSETKTQELKDVGANAIEEVYEVDLEGQMIPNTTLFALRKGWQNYFEANIQSFDVQIDGDYEESCKGMSEIVVETFTSKMAGAKIEVSNGREMIGKREFIRYTYSISLPNGIKLTTIFFNSLFDKTDLTVNILYINDSDGEIMLKLFRESTFE
ncbi:hypothetical protein [Flavobacterium alkalisoli]|uniref:hypothetical protein n=1 Tax=Flavobacterium alkalisoli TaxID=2602769 RepID=UPI003A8F602D